MVNAYRQDKCASFRKKAVYFSEEEYFHPPFMVSEFPKTMHTDTIQDVTECFDPMLVITACMDSLIRLISMNERKLVGVFRGHLTGVRQLDYTVFGEGYVLSIGHERFINVWSLEGGLGALQSNF
jgi:hypothetical protein